MTRYLLFVGILVIIFSFLSLVMNILAFFDVITKGNLIFDIVYLITTGILFLLVAGGVIYFIYLFKSITTSIDVISSSLKNDKEVSISDSFLSELSGLISGYVNKTKRLESYVNELEKTISVLKDYLYHLSNGEVNYKAQSSISEVNTLLDKTGKEIQKIVSYLLSVIVRMSYSVYNSGKDIYYLDIDTKEINTKIKELLDLISDISNSFVFLSQKLSEFLSFSIKSHDSFEKFYEISTNLEASWERFYSISGEVVKINKDMFNEVNDVINLSKSISEISEQTLLLSMNALIESSKVGDVGKGFSVIADEIRKLSENVSRFSKSVNEKLQSIKGKSNSITISIESVLEEGKVIQSYSKEIEGISNKSRDNFRNIIDSTEVISSSINSFSYKINDAMGRLEEFVVRINGVINNNLVSLKNNHSDISEFLDDIRVHISNNINIKNDKIIVSLSLADHVIWVSRLKGFIDGRATIDESVIFDHTKCRLGKWYYTEGMSKFSNLPEFKHLEKPHEMLHRIGGEIVELMQTRPEKAKDLFKEIINQSQMIVNDLMKIVDNLPSKEDSE
ncbi:MAG: methyl-accepting chemotaxis protein [Brevinematales bacterium]|nr:methyl-accepting chemotaxis protein [Brevinematales bacterium]